MSLDDIIAQEKAAKRAARNTPPPKAAKTKKPKQNAGPPRRNSRSDAPPKGQWRHDRFGVDEPSRSNRNGGNNNNRSPPHGRNGKSQNNSNNRGNQREGPLLSRAAREAQGKAGPITTAQLRANSKSNNYNKGHNRDHGRNRPKPAERNRSPERRPEPEPAPQETSVAIKGASGPATILVSNLDPEANTADLRECFGHFGELVEVSLLYDEHSRCSGNAEIKYGKKKEAQAAVDRMHNVVADNRTLIVQLKPDPVPSRSVPPPRQESRAAPAPSTSRNSSGPSRSSNRAHVPEKPYDRPTRRDSRR
ncbi:RNA-binding RNA annealing protein [Entomophthora muscae]|uniref:RNA-binding RNA annealing protein n=1 Tax=Entomophthora muscae TaxID=34485 RepID=A0ACC2S4T4_9FUNG|nr:RNA-binding RNA annealing protein [Entomophthora muscae]